MDIIIYALESFLLNYLKEKEMNVILKNILMFMLY